MCLSTISVENIVHPKFEILIFILMMIMGMLCIFYYISHNTNPELYKVAFVIILSFGLICSLIVPIMDVSDEGEHLIRSEITSQGVLIPHWTGNDMGLTSAFNITNNGQDKVYNVGSGYETIESMNFFDRNREITVFETNHDTDKIDNNKTISISAFEQNPFYGYLPQAIGIFIAKLLDLNLIWFLWLARIFNLICYAGLISLAIKKTPYLKIPLLAVACIPLTIYQDSSANIDSMIIGLGILSISYFIFMCKSDKLKIKNILLFTALCLLLGLCKLPYLAFIFLLLFVPKEKFNVNHLHIYLLVSIIAVGGIGLLWSKYSTSALLHSWRALESNANATQQITFLINHPNSILKFITQIFSSDLQFLFNGFFNFYNGTPGSHYTDNYYIITPILQLFLVIVLIFYPSDVDFSLKTKLGSFGILLLIYVGTCVVQLLSWANVGETNLAMSLRYFIPLFALLPVIFRFKLDFFNKEMFDRYVIVLIMGFMATLILAFTTKYY